MNTAFIQVNKLRHSLRITMIVCIWTSLSSSFLFAQSRASLRGVVKDAQTGILIEGASILIKGEGKGTTSNKDGTFAIRDLKPGDKTIVASFVGYGSTDTSTKLKSGVNEISILLSRKSTELSTVTIEGQTEEIAEVRKVVNNVMPVTVITAKEIENRAGNLNEILSRQAGVQLRLSGGLGSETRISVRGLEGKRVQIFLDGNPLNTPDGSLGINDLPVQIIERIEIYKGSVPAYLGGDGLGSAINVVFRHRDVSYIDASYSRQSFNTQIANLILKKSFDKQGIEMGVGIFDTRTDNNFKMESPYQKGLMIKRDHDKYRNLLVAASVRFHRWWFDEVEFEGAYVKNDREIQGIQKNIQHVESQGNSVLSVISLTKKNFLKNRLSLKYNLMFARFNVRFADTSSYNYNWDGTRYASLLGRGELGIGPNLSTNLQNDLRQRINLDYRYNDRTTINLNNTSRYSTLDPNDTLGNRYAGKNLFNYPGSLRNSITGLTLEQRFLNDRLLTSSAVKHYYNRVNGYNTSIYISNDIPDAVSTTTSEVGYTVGLRYNISKTFLVKTSYEKGIRLPTNTELFGDGILITPSTALKPEIAHNFNIGAVFDRTTARSKRIQLEANAFFMNVHNLIQLSGNGLTLGYVNYAKAQIVGVDLDLKVDITKNIFISVNGTFQQLTDKNRFIPGTDNVKNPSYNLTIPNIPRLFSNWSLEFHKDELIGKHSKSRIIYDGSFVDEFYYGFKMSEYDDISIPTYIIHTISLEQSFGHGRYVFSSEVNNLANAVVINNFNQPLPGRTIRVKVRYLLLGKSTNDNHHH